MNDMEKVVKALECLKEGSYCECCDYKPYDDCIKRVATDALVLIKEQDEFLKHEYWRGYNNGRADERGLQEGTVMQTFSPD